MAPWSSTFSQSQTAELPGSIGPSRRFVRTADLGSGGSIPADPARLGDWQNAPSYAGQFKRTITAGGDKKSPFSELATLHVWTLVALNVRPTPASNEDRQSHTLNLQPVMNPMTHQMYPVDAVVAYEKQHELVTSVRPSLRRPDTGSVTRDHIPKLASIAPC